MTKATVAALAECLRGPSAGLADVRGLEFHLTPQGQDVAGALAAMIEELRASGDDEYALLTVCLAALRPGSVPDGEAAKAVADVLQVFTWEAACETAH